MAWFSRTSDLLQRPDVEGQRQLLQRLSGKVQSAAGTKKLLSEHPSCLSVLVKLLSSSSAAVQEQAARVLGSIAQAETTFANRIAKTDGAITSLTALLSSKDSDIQLAAAWLLAHLGNSRANDKAVVQEPGALAGLVSLLSSRETDVQTAAIEALSNLSLESAANSERIGQEPGAITALTALLSSKDSDVRVKAAWGLAHLALDGPANRGAIGHEPGVLTGLVPLLRSREVDAQQAAAGVLRWLADYPANRERVGQQPGTIAGLAALLNSSQATVQRAAALALRSTALESPANSERIGQEPGAITGMTALLSSNDSVAQMAAAWGLAHLARECPANRGRIVQDPGALPGLVAQLSSREAKVQEAAAVALRWLAAGQYPENRERVGNEPGAVAGLAALLSSSHETVQRAAAFALRGIAFESPSNKDRIGQQPGAISGLILLLSSRHVHSVQCAAASALKNLACDCSANKRRIGQEPSAITGLIALLSSKDSDAQWAAAWVLAHLAESRGNDEGIGQEPGAVTGLVTLLSSSKARVQNAAVNALSNLALESPGNSKRIGQEPGAITGLTALLSSKNSDTQLEAAWALANLALEFRSNQEPICLEPGALTGLVTLLSSSKAGVQKAAVNALSNLALESPGSSERVGQEPGAITRLVALLSSSQASVQQAAAAALKCLASDSSANKDRISKEPGAIQGLAALQQLESSPDNTAAATLELLTRGDTLPAGDSSSLNGQHASTAAVGTRDQTLDTSSGASGMDASSGKASATPAAAASAHQVQDTASAPDQSGKTASAKTASGTNAKLATTALAAVPALAGVLGALRAVSKDVPFLPTIITPLEGFLIRVEEVRVNRAMAESMKKRVESLMNFLVCMFSSKELWHGVSESSNKVHVLQQQMERLKDALEQATAMVSKWGNPMILRQAVRFLKSNMDKEDILDFEETINKAVADLDLALSGITLQQTLEMQQQLQQLVREAKDSKGLEAKLEQANMQDLQQLQGHLEQLLGGQVELQQQLEHATEQQRQEWATVGGQLGQLAGDVGLIRDEVRELADAVRAWMDGRGNDQASSSSSGSGRGALVRSRLMLDREHVQWDASEPLAQGGFANVYHGTYAGHPVAVKLLRLSAFVGEEQREQMFQEAAVLSRLNHPCIVRFWGVVPVEERKPQPTAPQLGLARSSHDSASSLGSRGRVSFQSRSKLSLGLVLDRCDESLEDVLHYEPLLPLPAAVHIAERIACGLKYLHTEAPLRVVHGDLKPANVLLKGLASGTHLIQLTDFGLSSTIAVHTMSMGAQNLQVGRGFAGQSAGCTLWWAAPELLEAWAQGLSAPHTFAGDMYAFGLILYQLLVGRWPYTGMFTAEDALKAAVRKGTRPSWAGLEEVRGGKAAAVVDKLKTLVEACWAHDAAKRLTAQQVHAQLVELQHEVLADV